MEWTDEQRLAISAPAGRGNILVSAAAGSGKTAVLVERILTKILEGAASVDRLLVVTFTEAAAAEMREKIISRLSKEANSPSCPAERAKLLSAQTRLAETADIMTIDAFCSRVVQNNFHALGADPNVGVIDAAMTKLMQSEAAENLFDRLYKTGDEEERERFSRLLEIYASDSGESGLSDVIFFIYKFIMSFADPEEWLDKAALDYTLPASETRIAKYREAVSRRAAADCIAALDESEREAADEGLLAYIRELRAAAEELINAEDWDGLYSVYERLFKKKRGKKAAQNIQPPPESTDGQAERVLFVYEKLRGRLERGVTESLADFSAARDSGALYAEAEDLVWIVKEFKAEFSALKDKNGVREFSDIEHMTHELFRDHADIRERYANKYDEILIDEYQDTNGLQDSIFTLISRDNIFMVGDLKQSIYRFRGGDPYIFRDKSDKYIRGDSDGTRLVLSQNFRSRKEVLSAVNDVFERVMSREAGDVDYTGTERIVRLKDYYPAPESELRAELHYLAVRGESGADKDNEEIVFTAEKIRELLGSGMRVYDKDTGALRPIRKKDIVILQSSVKATGEAFVKALADRGIGAFAETESFFSRREISVMLSLISVINNARQDIELLAVLRSPIGGFTENELARIRLSGRVFENYISAVRSFAKSGGRRHARGKYRFKRHGRGEVPRRERLLAKKCRDFLEKLRRWRGYVRNKSVAQLIWAIYEETYFYDMMGAIEQGEEAQFNLRLLYERARQYESAGFKGLFNFIKYIERVEGRDEDLGGAKLIGENHDVVRIMTIHKSKGLEFPVVFLCGAGRRFPTAEDVSVIRLHKDLGFGLPRVYYDERYMRDTKIKDTIRQINKDELSAERMRLLYVALTRAREKLFVTVSAAVSETETEETLKANWSGKLEGGRMLPETALSARSFSDWLCPAALASGESWRLIFHDIRKAAGGVEPEAEDCNTYEDSAELRRAVYEILDYRYPYAESSVVPSRTSVTQLKELTITRGGDETVYEPDSRRTADTEEMADLMFSPLHQRPAFMRETGEKPANEIGTLYHTVMSEIDLALIAERGAKSVSGEIERLADAGRISREDLKYIKAERIEAFFESDTGGRVLRSREVLREKPFQISIPATEYDPSLPPEYAAEELVLQGIIDCCFVESGGWVLLDYKTDKVRGDKLEIRRKYEKQLELYKLAIERLTSRPVTESLLYLFDIGETV